MNVEQLRVESDRRGLDSSKATKKADWIALLKHDDEVKAAIAAGNYDALTVDELKASADARKVDISGKSAKADLAAALKAADGPVVSG